MASSPNLLLLEDNPGDEILLVRQLARVFLHFDYQRVETEADFRLALKGHRERPLVLILMDFVLPSFDALHALRILRDEGLSIPVIVVTGYLSEVRAREFLVFGADAYLSKDKLDELPALVRRVLADPHYRKD